MTVKPTTDRAYLRRWMLRPAFVRAMGGFPDGVDPDAAFSVMLQSDAKFVGVWDDGHEKGCIIFNRVPGAWGLHLCLATWWTKTRIALKQAIAMCIPAGETVVAEYDGSRASLNRLLDDIGFSSGDTHEGKRIRTFTI